MPSGLVSSLNVRQSLIEGAYASLLDTINRLHRLDVHNGDVAQMVERSLSMREARGSIPRISKAYWFAIFLFRAHCFVCFCAC